MVSHGEYADRTGRQTDGRTDGRTDGHQTVTSLFARRGQRNDINLILEDGVCQLGAHDADAPAGIALKLDDLVGGVDDLVVQLAPILMVAFRVLAGCWTHVPQSRAGDVDAAPDRHARVAVLADDVASRTTRTVCVTYRVSRKLKYIRSVRPSVRPSVSSLSFEPLILSFCLCIGHDHSLSVLCSICS